MQHAQTQLAQASEQQVELNLNYPDFKSNFKNMIMPKASTGMINIYSSTEDAKNGTSKIKKKTIEDLAKLE